MTGNNKPDCMAIIKVGIADDHTLFRRGLARLIGGFGRMRVTLEASNGRELLELLENARGRQFPDVILMDIEMPETDGMQATEEITKRYPGLKVIALSQYEESRLISGIMKQGARAYLLKTSLPEEVESTIWRVYDRGYYYSEMVSEAMHNKLREDKAAYRGPLPRFTVREQQVFDLLCRGMKCSEIACKLKNSVSTVEKQRKKVLEKTGCANNVELVTWAMRMGLME